MIIPCKDLLLRSPKLMLSNPNISPYLLPFRQTATNGELIFHVITNGNLKIYILSYKWKILLIIQKTYCKFCKKQIVGCTKNKSQIL